MALSSDIELLNRLQKEIANGKKTKNQLDQESIDELATVLARMGNTGLKEETNTPLLAGQLERVGPFEQLCFLGFGGFGIVYQALDSRLNRMVALKLPRLEWKSNERVMSRFVQEAKIVAQLKHPNIVPVFESGTVAGTFFIASELSEGVSLNEWIVCNREPSVQTIVGIVEQVANAIAYAHRQGVIHRDLKPTNLLVEKAETIDTDDDCHLRVRVTDFGLAIELADVMASVSTSLVGTPAYMAPEQFLEDRDNADHRMDIFSIGVVAYEVAAGFNPFASDSIVECIRKIREETPTPLIRLRKDLPIEYSQIVSKCLEKQPRDRYQTSAELLEDLNLLANGETVNVKQIGPVQRYHNWMQRPRRIDEASFLMIAINIVFVFWIATLSLSAMMGLSSPGSPTAIWPDMTLALSPVLFGNHIPMILAGVFLKRMKSWMVWIAFGLSLIVYGWSLLMAAGMVDTPFPIYNENPVFRVFVLSLVSGLGCFQTLWIGFAAMANQNKRFWIQ